MFPKTVRLMSCLLPVHAISESEGLVMQKYETKATALLLPTAIKLKYFRQSFQTAEIQYNTFLYMSFADNQKSGQTVRNWSGNEGVKW